MMEILLALNASIMLAQLVVLHFTERNLKKLHMYQHQEESNIKIASSSENKPTSDALSFRGLSKNNDGSSLCNFFLEHFFSSDVSDHGHRSLAFI